MNEIDYIEKTEIEIMQGLSDCIANLNRSVANINESIAEIKNVIYAPCINSGISDEIKHREMQAELKWNRHQAENKETPICQ